MKEGLNGCRFQFCRTTVLMILESFESKTHGFVRNYIYFNRSEKVELDSQPNIENSLIKTRKNLLTNCYCQVIKK